MTEAGAPNRSIPAQAGSSLVLTVRCSHTLTQGGTVGGVEFPHVRSKAALPTHMCQYVGATHSEWDGQPSLGGQQKHTKAFSTYLVDCFASEKYCSFNLCVETVFATWSSVLCYSNCHDIRQTSDIWIMTITICRLHSLTVSRVDDVFPCIWPHSRLF